MNRSHSAPKRAIVFGTLLASGVLTFAWIALLIWLAVGILL